MTVKISVCYKQMMPICGPLYKRLCVEHMKNSGKIGRT